VLPVITVVEVIPLNPPANAAAVEMQPKEDKASPFLYSPAAMVIRRSIEENIPVVTWVAGDNCEVVVTFANPLCFDIQVTDMQLCTNGSVVVECFPQVVHVPAGGKKTATLLCKVTGTAGQLTIHGILVQALGVGSYTPLRANGKGFNDSEFYSQQLNAPTIPAGRKVTVVDEIPKLGLWQRTSQPPAELQLLDRELFRYHLEIQNRGTRPIGFVEFQIAGAPEGSCSVEGWSPSALPLLPGCHVPVCLAIRAQL
jgi:hypothetical protein